MSAVSDPTAAIELSAGDLRATFVDGDLRAVIWRGSPVAQRIYMAVRDRAWNTIPAIVKNPAVTQDSMGFTVEFEATNRYGDIEFDWHCSIAGDAAGTLSYEWTGHARCDFEYCKIGLNIHHGVAEHLGRPYSIRTEAGRVDGRFEADIVPQLVENGTLTAMTPYFDQLTVQVDGAEVAFGFEGDLFELQDHRNWADANWKTYGTPLAFGFPTTLRREQTLHQAVRISVTGEGVDAADDAVPSCWVSAAPARPLPRIGHLWTRDLVESELAMLRAIRPDHIRVDLHPLADSGALVRAASRACDDLSCHLEVAVFVRPDAVDIDVENAVVALAAATVSVDRVLVLQSTGGFSEFGGAVPAAIAERVAESAIAAGAILAGTPQSFNDLNRDRPDYSRIDGVVFALNPQVHAADDASLVQNARTIPLIVEFARRVFGNVEIALSPVDLVGAGGPFPAGPNDQRAANEDPRQWAPFAAAWTLAAISEMADCGTTSATLFELTGARGLVDGAKASPLVRLLADLAEARQGHAVSAGTSDRDRIAVLAFGVDGTIRVFIANLTAEPLRCTLSGGELTLRPYEVVLRNVDDTAG